MNNKMIGVAAIIAAAAVMVTAIATAVSNLLSFRWAVKAYEPFARFMQKSEPLLGKMVSASEKYVDEYLNEED